MKITFNGQEYDEGLNVLQDEEIEALDALNQETNGFIEEFFKTLLNPKKGKQNDHEKEKRYRS